MHRPPRALPRGLLARRAHDEPPAALRPAALEDFPPCPRRVALAKAMLAVAADLARLIRALHGGLPPESEKRGKKARATRQVKERPLRTKILRRANDSGQRRHRSGVDPATLEILLDPVSPPLLGSAALFFVVVRRTFRRTDTHGHRGAPRAWGAPFSQDKIPGDFRCLDPCPQL
jgi:hypothetical protein